MIYNETVDKAGKMDAGFQERLSRFISAQQLDKVDDPPRIAEAIQHLNSLYKALFSFLPLYIEDEIHQAAAYSALRLGTFMFADVSGFTALSERMQREDADEGAEILTGVINDYFAEMLEILAKSDGQLIKFAGDALLAFFPAKREGISDALKAVRTGLRMQRAIQRFQPIRDQRVIELLKGEEYSLVMSIGMARGKLFEMLVGNNVQRDHIILGDLPGAAMAAEGVGNRDEVIVDSKLAALLVGHFSVKRMERGFSRVIDSLGGELGDYEFEALGKRRAKSSALFDLSKDMLIETLRQSLTRVETMAAYVAPSIVRELVLSDDYHLRSSNRFTVTMFVNATGFAEMLQAWGEEHRALVASIMERYYSIVQRAITTRGGTLARTDPYQRGVKLLATFGAPVSHSDDPDRAVDAAWEMHTQLAELNFALTEKLPEDMRRTPFITQRVGITQGYTFAGEVGWKARREFTVMGDDVNLAARLMGKAENDQIIISQRVYERVKNAVEVEALPPMVLKGKTKPIQVYKVLRPALTAVDLSESGETPLVGHGELLDVLSTALKDAAQKSRARHFALVGHHGVGKTRIAREVAHQAGAAHFRVAWVTCSHRGSYRTMFQALIGQLLNIKPDDSAETLRERLHDFHLLDLEAGMRDLLLTERGTETTLTINAFTALLVRFFNTYVGQIPTLLVVDELQREHSVGLDILNKMLKSITRAQLVTLLLYEPPFAPALEVERHEIGDLNADELGRIAAAQLNVEKIGERLKALLWDKTHGRPMYAEEYVRMLAAHNCIDGGELSANADTDLLPDSLRETVMSRIDALPADAQAVLRAAAVLGDHFTPEALNIVGEMGDEAQVRAILRQLSEAMLLKAVDDWVYAFRQELVRGAIYASLARSVRLKLHRLAVNYWKAHRAVKHHHRHLAFHLTKCGLLPQAIEVLTEAGDEAEKRGDVEGAEAIYRHALTILPDEKGIAARLEQVRRRP